MATGSGRAHPAPVTSSAVHRCLGCDACAGDDAGSLALAAGQRNELRCTALPHGPTKVVSMALENPHGKELVPLSPTFVRLTNEVARAGLERYRAERPFDACEKWLSGPPSVPHWRLGFSVYVLPCPNLVLGTVQWLSRTACTMRSRRTSAEGVALERCLGLR